MRHLRHALPLLLQTLSFVTFAQSGVNDSLLSIVRLNLRDKAEARALNELAVRYSRTDLPRAISCLHEAIGIASAADLTVQLSASYSQLAIDKLDLGEKDSAHFYLDKLKLFTEAHPELRMNYMHAAGLYYKNLQDFKSALPFLLQDVDDNINRTKTDSSVANLTSLAGSYLNVGNNISQMGDFKTAQRYHLDALRLFERVGNKKGISYCYQMIGSNFLQLVQLKPASEYTRMGLALKTELNDTRGVATSLQQLGAIFRAGLHLDSAIKYDLLTLEINQRLGLKINEANMDLEIGNCYKDMQNDSAAQRYFEHGRAVSRAIGDTTRTAIFDAALTSVRNNSEDRQLTEQRLLKTANTSARTNDMINLAINYDYLSEYYAHSGQTQKAFEYIKKYYWLNDSLNDLNTQIQLRKMEGQYNVDKKEQEIALLKKDQQLSHVNLEKQRAVLTAQNAVLEKQKLFQYGALILVTLLLLIGFLVINRYRIVHRARRAIELEKMRNHIARDLHDDIGSTLSSIHILSKVALQSPAADGPRSSLEKIMSRSAAIMEKMDDIVWTINPQNDTMEQLLYRMKEFAAEILEPLNINYNFEANEDFSSLKLDIRRRKDLYLIFKEAVNNAAKYSQCSNLNIRLRRDGDSLQLEIADDGKGFAAETIKAGNGLNNMRERAASMLAGLKIDSAIGRGTRIDLDLPIT
jgi:two-component system, NarL family, sensor histidine kinase UhpB